jgi:hypothetical protein
MDGTAIAVDVTSVYRITGAPSSPASSLTRVTPK